MSHPGLNAVLTSIPSRSLETLDVIPQFGTETQGVNFTFVRTPASTHSAKANVDEGSSDTKESINIQVGSKAGSNFQQYDANDRNIIELKKRRNIKKVSTALSKYGIYAIQFAPNGKKIAVGYGNGSVCMVNSDKEDTIVSPTIHGQKKKFPTVAIKFHSTENLVLTAGAAGEVNAWDSTNFTPTTEPKASLVEDGNEINALDICSDGMMFGTAGKDRNIRLYDTNTLRLYHTITAPDALAMDESSIFGGHSQRIFALKFHPKENHLFVTAGWDNCMKIWDKRMARAARKSIAGPRVCGDAIDILENHIITGSYVAKDAVQLWDMRGEFLLNVNFPHNKQKGDFIYCAKFINKDTVIAGGSGINAACAINLKNDSLVDVMEYGNKAVLAVDAWQDGDIIVNGGIGGILQVAYLNSNI